jgi:hypothetical protein
MPADAAPARRAASRVARGAETLLVGGATLLLMPLAWACRRRFGLDGPELAVGFVTFHAAHVINDPHFAVTYLLFYKGARRRAFGDAFSPMQRARYLVSGVLVPVVLAGWASLALARHSAPALGGLIQLMFLLVGWHYGKQGFGVLSVLSARRGVTLTRVERQVLLAHSYAAWAYAWASPADPGTEMEERGVVYWSVPHGIVLEHATFAAFATSALAVAWVLVARRRRTGRFLPVGPLAAYLVTLWLWTVYTRLDRLMVYVIPALHSVQYLYFVWLLERNRVRAAASGSPFGQSSWRPLALVAASAVGLGWLVFHGAPGVLDAALFPVRRHVDPGSLGAAPCAAAVFACVNIHHYFMDHVIWRRENPETRHLVE